MVSGSGSIKFDESGSRFRSIKSPNWFQNIFWLGDSAFPFILYLWIRIHITEIFLTLKKNHYKILINIFFKKNTNLYSSRTKMFFTFHPNRLHFRLNDLLSWSWNLLAGHLTLSLGRGRNTCFINPTISSILKLRAAPVSIPSNTWPHRWSQGLQGGLLGGQV